MTSIANLQSAIRITKQINRLEAQRAKLLGSNSSNGAALIRKPMSQSARLKIAAAQRRRWGQGASGEEMRVALLALLLLSGCAQGPSLVEQQRVIFQRQLANQERINQQRTAHIDRRAAWIKTLPQEQRLAEIDRLEREIDSWQREEREQDMIDSQRKVARSIDDLSAELEQRRLMSY